MDIAGAENVTLLIFCKQPRTGQGKQRIAATLGAEKTVTLANALLECALEDARGWPGPVILAPAANEEVNWASAVAANAGLKAEILPQGQGNLGQRIVTMDQKLRQRGVDKILLIGTDAPILSHVFYQQAIQVLDRHDVVFSAATDGGVTLMANRQPWPAHLADLPWSTPSLNSALASSCEIAGAQVGYISPSYDIDYEQDLRCLQDDLAKDERPARQALYRLIVELIEQPPSITKDQPMLAMESS